MKYLLSLLLTFFTSCLLAQNPTYEQTVEFIKNNVVGRMLYEGALDSYKRETGHKLTKIEIQKDGRIKLVADQQQGHHDFEIVFNIFDLKSSIDYPDGIRAYKFLVHFQGLNVSKGYGITFATDADAKRVARAFRHLKTMCSKGGGLFDEPTQSEKKPTLTKTETMKYIENLLNNSSELSFNVSGGKNNLNQNFNANTGSFNSFNYQSVNDAGGYGYFENDEDFNNITQTLIKNIRIITPDPKEYSYRFQKKFYSVKIDFETPIQRSFKYRSSHNTLTHEISSISEAKNNCRSQSWKHNNENKSYVEIFMKNESDAKRLKNAFEHLAALIKEEKNANEDNDPFGG